MAKQKISITRALIELKRFDQRIQQALVSGTFSAVSFGEGDNKVTKSFNGTQLASEQVAKTNINASFQSVTDLINNRAAMKAAIIQSNAVTKVTIMGREMTVAEAIELKASKAFLANFLQTVNAQLTRTRSMSAEATVKMEQSITTLTQAAVAGGKSEELLIKSIREAQQAAHKPAIVSEELTVDRVNKLQAEITDIEANLDYALTEINSKTEIEVDL